MPDFGRRPSNGGDPSLDDVNRVDQFFDALAARQTPYSTGRAEAELAFLLSGWRDDIRDTPITVPVTTRDATAALREGLSRRARRGRASLALVGSVAAAVLCIGGFGAAVFGSGPGDALYGMRTALFGQQEVRDDRVSLASAQLAQVRQMVDRGQWQQAQDKLVELSSTVQNVEAPPQQKQDLVSQWNALSYKVVEQDAAATLPAAGEPLPALPANSPLTLLPVPAVNTSTSTSTAPSSDSATSSTPTSVSTTPTTTDASSASPTATTSAPPASTAASTTAASTTTTATVTPTPTTPTPTTPTPTTPTPTTPTPTTTAQPATTAPPTTSTATAAVPSATVGQSEQSTVPSAASSPGQSSQERRSEPTTAASTGAATSAPAR